MHLLQQSKTGMGNNCGMSSLTLTLKILGVFLTAHAAFVIILYFNDLSVHQASRFRSDVNNYNLNGNKHS